MLSDLRGAVADKGTEGQVGEDEVNAGGFHPDALAIFRGFEVGCRVILQPRRRRPVLDDDEFLDVAFVDFRLPPLKPV